MYWGGGGGTVEGGGKIRKVNGSNITANGGREIERRKSVTTTKPYTAVLTQLKDMGGRGEGGRGTARMKIQIVIMLAAISLSLLNLSIS